MGTEKIAGKPSTVIGTQNTNLVLRGQSVKIQYGNKFIDLIKDGKICSNQSNTAQSQLESSSESKFQQVEGDIVLTLQGQNLNLSELTDKRYVSYNLEQVYDYEQKLQSLKNIGFYYNGLSDVSNDFVGIAYIMSENKLYICNKGQMQEYNQENYKSYKDLDVESLKTILLFVGKNQALKVDTTDKIANFYAAGFNFDGHANFNEDLINLHKPIVVKTYVQSKDYVADMSGFKLYSDANGVSTLEVDNIIERASSVSGTTASSQKNIYSYYNNTIINITLKNEQDNKDYGGDQTILTLLYENKYQVDDVIGLSKDPTLAKSELMELVVMDVTDTTITVNAILSNDFINSNVYLINKPYIKIEDNNLELLENNLVNTKLGKLEDSLITPTSSDYGLYSGNFVGLNSKLYDAKFKSNTSQYPSYDGISIPDKFTEDTYNNAIPNVEWVKSLINSIIPVGTITMFHGNKIPDGWAICDGKNGTPNLINKFIKAGSSENSGTYTKDVTLTTSNLPSHNHSIPKLTTNSTGDHKHSLIEALVNPITKVSGGTSEFALISGDTTSAGSHSHTISATNTGEVGSSTSFNTVSLEYYSLIFIMKTV